MLRLPDRKMFDEAESQLLMTFNPLREIHIGQYADWGDFKLIKEWAMELEPIDILKTKAKENWSGAQVD